MTHTEIRPAEVGDLADLARVADETGLFPSEMLPEMARPALSGENGVILLAGLRDRRPVGLCYVVQETLADGVWNMLALGVLPALQRDGLGARMVAHVEAQLRDQSQRMIIVDTSGSDSFAGARAFYIRNGFEQEARIRDYWAEGDDKLTFRKLLVAG